MQNSLPVLVLKDTVLLPSSELRMDFNTTLEKHIFSIAEGYHDSNLLIVNTNLDINSSLNMKKLPTIGIVGIIKMHIDLPNGKTKIVVYGTRRVKV